MLVPKTNSQRKLQLHSLKLGLAFAAIYVIWGSTYLAIRYAVETIPPLVTAGIRHTVAGGILLAWAAGRVLVSAISTGPFPIELDLTPNWHVLGFTGAVAVTTGIVFGLAPVFHLIGAGPSPALKDDARMSGSRSRLLSSLVSVQVALSLLLLVGAGLFVQTLRNLQNLDPGFKREGVLLIDLAGRRTALPPELVDEVRRVPGVVSASVSTHTTLSGAVWSDIAVPKGQTIPDRDTAYFNGAGPHFFETMQTPLRAGREFTERDSAGALPVAIVNEAFARRHFPNQDFTTVHHCTKSLRVLRYSSCLRDKPSLHERFSELGSASAKGVLIILLEPSTRSSKASDAEHQRHELRSQAARHVNRPPVGRELRHPVECAAVGERYLEAVARLRRDLEAQAAVVVRVLEPGARD